MASIKKVIVFGATGNTGTCCLQSAVELGYEVTAFIRDASKLPSDLVSQVKAVIGDTNNVTDVEEALEGQDAVVIALGTRNDLSPTTVISDGTKNILTAMEKHGIKRVSACISAFLFWERSKVPERFHPLTEDHERMLEALKASDREWIAVMPPHIADTPGTGSPVVVHDEGPGRTISKYDLGKFLVSCLTQDNHIRQICGICDQKQ